MKLKVGDLLKYHMRVKNEFCLGVVIQIKADVETGRSIKIHWFDDNKPTWEDAKCLNRDGIFVVSRG